FDEVIRVPLVVKFPRRRHAGTRVKAQVQTMDILPTVIEEIGAAPPAPPAIAGRPLGAALGHDPTDRLAVSAVSHHGNVAAGIRTADDKYIRRFSPKDDALYFNLRKDPAETTNRI